AIQESLSTSAEVSEARTVVDKLARGDVDGVAAGLSLAENNEDVPGTLRKMTGFFPKSAPTRVRLVGYNARLVSQLGGATVGTYDVGLESTYPGVTVLTQVRLVRKDGGALAVTALRADPLRAPLDVLNAFTFTGKGTEHYVFLAVMAAVAAVQVVALRAWFRRRKLIRRRWWWLAGILVGPFKLGLNWTTGAVVFQTLTIQLFSLGFIRDGFYGPWTLWLSITAGAIAFLLIGPPTTTLTPSPASPSASPSPDPTTAPAARPATPQ